MQKNSFFKKAQLVGFWVSLFFVFLKFCKKAQLEGLLDGFSVG